MTDIGKYVTDYVDRKIAEVNTAELEKSREQGVQVPPDYATFAENMLVKAFEQQHPLMKSYLENPLLRELFLQQAGFKKPEDR